nr:zinc finger, CCHC-type, retrotransposon Gag domain protein [Tanacetum cinerariifolium]
MIDVEIELRFRFMEYLNVRNRLCSSGLRRFFRYAMFIYSFYLCYSLSLYPFTERYAQPYFFSCLIRQTFKTLCLLNYALMKRHDYDITSSLRRRALQLWYQSQGNALAWWKAYKQAKGGDAWLITVTWADFKKLFFLQFFPRAEQDGLKREYHSIRQTNTETSTKFMQHFLRLAGFLRAAAGTEEEQAKNF